MKRISKTFIFIISSLFVLNANPNLDSTLAEIKQQYHVVGMSVVITKDSEIIFSGGYGKRDISRSLSVNDSTTYRIASISKMVVATALMQLYEQGAFKLEEDVSKYLDFDLKNPKYPEQKITFKKLLSHTSSLRDGSGYHPFLSAAYSNDPPHIKELLTPEGDYYSADMFSSHSPKSNYFKYSNINYGMLGTLIESISGQRFDRYCRNHVLQPLGMEASFNIHDLSDINNMAVLYRKSGGKWQPQTDNYKGSYPEARNLENYQLGENGVLFSPQGGLRCSANDLAKFLIAHSNNGAYKNRRILNDTTAVVMHEPKWHYNGSNGNNYYGIFNNYGLGNHTTSELLPRETMIGHPGEAYGLISDMYFSKKYNFGIIFITNGGEWGFGNSGWYNIEEDIFQSCIEFIDTYTELDFQINQHSPDQFKLDQNYPNPFNSGTEITFSIPEYSSVKLAVYDLQGRHIETLINDQKSAGRYSTLFRNKNIATGFYYYRLESDELSDTRKMLLLK